jgi:hypothetical protein
LKTKFQHDAISREKHKTIFSGLTGLLQAFLLLLVCQLSIPVVTGTDAGFPSVARVILIY